MGPTKENKWQTVDVTACIVREKQGFICESNTMKAQDICLDRKQNICHFEMHPDEITKTAGCNFSYSAPVMTHQLLQSKYASYQDLSPTPIGMNLTLVRKLLQYDDLNQLLKRV